MLLDKLGAGAMGVVYAAYDPQLDRKVAVKILRPGVSGRHGRVRLLREAQALARLAHPHVVGIHDVGVIGEELWLAMELVEGRTLRAWLRTPRSWREVLRVMIGAGEGLAAVHAAGLLHRDCKPDNVMVGNDGRARVMDFGLVRLASNTTSATTNRHPSASASDILMAALTVEGSLVGTPAYMPPEQFDNAEITAAADQFSFCVTLWEALYRERPFMPNVARGALRVPPKTRRVPRRLRSICERGMARDPRDRWPSMAALLEQLRRVAAPRRRWAALAGPIAAVGLVGAAAGWSAPAPLHCSGAQAQLAEVWNQARKSEVQAALEGTRVAYASATWRRVEERLDHYGEAWTRKHTEVCEAQQRSETQGDQEFGLRMRCVDQRKIALRSAVEMLAAADSTVVKHAVDLVAGLPSLERCDDLEALQAAVPPPEDLDIAREVELQRARLASLKAAMKAGARASVVAGIDRVVERATALRYRPLEAEAKVLRGSLREREGRYAQAEHDLLEAYTLAMEHRHDDVALRASLSLAVLLSYRHARHAEGMVWSRTALAHAERSGERVMIARSMHTAGKVLYGRGDYEQAERYYQQAERTFAEELGLDHPEYVAVLSNLGALAYGRGDHDRARRYYEQVVELRSRSLGPDHPHVASSLSNLGVMHHERGDLERAQRYYERALELREALLPADHPDVMGIVNNLGVLLADLGEHAQARRYHERVLRVWEAKHGPDHPEVALARINLGQGFEAQQRYGEARAQFQRALEIKEGALGADHPEVAEPLLGLARVAMARHDYGVAAAHAERVVSLLEAAGVTKTRLARARFLLARASWDERSQRARARGLAERARRVYTTHGDEDSLAEVEAWLLEHPAAA